MPAAAIFSSSRPLMAKGSNSTPAVKLPRRSAFQPAAAVRQEPVSGHAEGAVRGQRGAVRRALHPRPPRLVGALSGGTAELWQRQLHRARDAARGRGIPVGGLEEAAGIASHNGGAPPRLRRLLRTLHRQKRVVVLVDEYDKPILDALEAPEVARANRDYLRGLYGVIKDSDAHVRFTTGISKFSKVGGRDGPPAKPKAPPVGRCSRS